MRDRYEVRRGDAPGQWMVWDTHTDTVVFGAESMTESAATEYAKRLNDAYREFRRGVTRGSAPNALAHTFASHTATPVAARRGR